MIIIDYSQVALSNIFMFQNDLKKGAVRQEDAVNIVRHAILSGIKYYKKKYGREYGEMVIACDGQNYWRRKLFPYYKASRSKQREKSDLDWKLIFDTISSIRDDLEAHFPYKVVSYDSAEADDIIATLCKWTQTNGIVDYGIVEEQQKVLIISADKDFKQLQIYKNVKQWSPMQKKFVTCDGPVQDFLTEHIVRGDSGDGIPNIFSPDAVFVTEGIKQQAVTSKKLANFIENGRDACQTDEEKRNWDRNRDLIDFNFIPQDIQDVIVSIYENKKPGGDKMAVMNYLIKHRCRMLLDELDEF